MPRTPAPVRAALAAAALLVFPASLHAESACPPPAPTVTGPTEVNLNQGYSISWTNVLGANRTTQADVFVVERSNDATFTTGVERFQTTRTSASWTAPGGSPRTIYHRVGVQTWCTGGAAGVLIDSAVFALRVTSECPAPIALDAPKVSPADPPVFTTYIVSWDTLGADAPGPGGGAQGLHFRLRRMGPNELHETINDTGSAAFADGPGEYLYDVRTENACGETGPWSPAARVVVGATKTAALALVSTPKPVFVPGGAGDPVPTAFTVRNGGTQPLDVTATSDRAAVGVEPASFRLAPYETRVVTVRVKRPLDADVPLHADVVLIADGLSLHVPIDAAVGEGVSAGGGPSGGSTGGTVPEKPVGWDEEALDINRSGSPAQRTLVNPGRTPAPIVASISTPWLTVTSLDGRPWDRPLAPGEARALSIGVDRSLRRAAIGTEVGTVSILTAGHPDAVMSLSVADDGPLVAVGPPSADSGLPPLYLMKSRFLFPSLPNARDAAGIGRYTSDVWLSNVDALAPIQVVMTLTPAGQANTSAGVRQFVFSLGAGETRRFRNVIGTVFGFEGASSLDVSSPSPTLSATAMVKNKPTVAPVAGAMRAKTLASAIEGTLLTNAEFGFEMRPVAPGEGANAYDPSFVVSGLWHDAKRRTNLILRETTGNQTLVRVQLFDQAGTPVLRGGQAVDFEITVPALGSLQINDADLFPQDAILGSLWARLEFRYGVIDPFGRNRGAVVPFATVIDAGTQDASLRVGVSTTALAPASSTAAPALKALNSALPFDGGPEPLLFPAAHVTGAALASGASPRWRTRVTFSNVSDTEQRTVRLVFEDKSGRLPGSSTASSTVVLSPRATATLQDVLEDAFLVPGDAGLWGTVKIDNVANEGAAGWKYTWKDVDVQTETYTADTDDPTRGEFRTGMEAYSYRHGYSSFQSNLGTVIIDGAETSPRFRTNLIVEEVGNAPCVLAVGVYTPGSLVPLAISTISLKPLEYVSKELFREQMGLDLDEIVDARVVVRQLDGDGVFMAFVSKINLVTGDPANVFLRPASAGTGR